MISLFLFLILLTVIFSGSYFAELWIRRVLKINLEVVVALLTDATVQNDSCITSNVEIFITALAKQSHCKPVQSTLLPHIFFLEDSFTYM
jgi:hypothetical protein